MNWLCPSKKYLQESTKADVAAAGGSNEEDMAIQAIKALMYFHFCYPTAETYRSATGSVNASEN